MAGNDQNVDKTYKVPSCVIGMTLCVPHDSSMRLGYQGAVLHKWTLTWQAHHLPAPLQPLCGAPTAAAPAALACHSFPQSMKFLEKALANKKKYEEAEARAERARAAAEEEDSSDEGALCCVAFACGQLLAFQEPL